MPVSSSFIGMVTLASAYVTAPADAQVSLPWVGSVQSLADVKEKYMTHIFTQRNGGKNGKIEDYVTVEANGRTPAYNKDTSVINIGVDAKAVFNTQNNFRRSELVQKVEAEGENPLFFRASIMKDKDFINPHPWQSIFTEEKSFEIRVDATLKPPKIMLVMNGTWDAKWETDFVAGTWYNFGFVVSPSGIGGGTKLDFYASEGEAELALVRSDNTITAYSKSQEFHVGLLTLSDDGSAPKMAAEQDIVSFNGISVESGGPAGSPSGSAPSTEQNTPGTSRSAEFSNTPSTPPAKQGCRRN
ncbi:hypothetical protein PsorP6_019611 [Peronosclerospora sorghi]|nr:hypothetical protein PsorP6_019611 [Peronosclerospora sorghi]